MPFLKRRKIREAPGLAAGVTVLKSTVVDSTIQVAKVFLGIQPNDAEFPVGEVDPNQVSLARDPAIKLFRYNDRGDPAKRVK